MVLKMPDIAEDKPAKEQYDVESYHMSVFNPGGEPCAAGAFGQQFAHQKQQKVRGCKQHEVIVADGFDNLPLQQGMYQSLVATAWALPTGEGLERALGHPMQGHGVDERIKCEQHHRHHADDDDFCLVIRIERFIGTAHRVRYHGG